MTEKEKKQKDLFAYKAVLSAFLFKADHLSMQQDDILSELRDIGRISNEEHKKIKLEVITEKAESTNTKSSSKKTKVAAPQAPAFHAAAPKKTSKPAVAKVSKQQQRQEAPKSHQRAPVSKPKARGKVGKLPAVDPFVGKQIKIHDRVYSDDPDTNEYHEAVVLSYDELLGVHKLAFSFNQVNEHGVTLEEYDDMNLYDMSRDNWIDTGEIIDFKNLGAPLVVRSEEANAATVVAPPAEAEAGAAGDAEPDADPAATPPAPEATTNGAAVVESEFFPDTVLEVERAHDRQTLQDIREMICEREHLIRMALDELRVADTTKQETTAVLEPSPQQSAGKGDGGGGEPGTEAGGGGGGEGGGGEGTVPMDTDSPSKEPAPLQPKKEEDDPAPPPAEEGADAAAAGNGGVEKTPNPPKEVAPEKTAVEANGVEA